MFRKVGCNGYKILYVLGLILYSGMKDIGCVEKRRDNFIEIGELDVLDFGI